MAKEEDAQKVRTIVRRYLALASIGLLIEDLYRGGIRPKARFNTVGAVSKAPPARSHRLT
jgi:hypothetical protein